MPHTVAGLVVITGGSSGIGRCTASLFARRGWRVGLIARGAAGLATSRQEVEAAGACAATAQADVTDSIALRQAAGRIITELGPIDIWINCAGNGVYGRFDTVPEAEFQRVTDVTYHGTVNGTRIALAHMKARGHGSIINVCSAVAFHGVPLMSSYSGAKAAVRAFGQSLRSELRRERSRVRISTVFPPAVNTPFFSHAPSHMGWPAQPLRPVYQPEVIAQGIWQAAMRGRPEMTITGTAAIFSLATRIAPALVAWCMGRLGAEGQLTRDPGAVLLLEPTLFVPAQHVFDRRGPFGKWARRWSLHLWLARRAMPAAWLTPAWPRRGAPSNARLPPIPVPAEPDRGLGDLAPRPGDP